MLKKFFKLCKNHKKVLVFPVLRSKVHILGIFSKNLRRRASSRLQLLEALLPTASLKERGSRCSLLTAAAFLE